MGSKDHYLFENPEDTEYWRRVFSYYDEVLKLKADKMKPEKGKDLKHLDKWFQTELPGVIAARKEKFITYEEMCKLMKWKLTRGKFRPKLTEMVAGNRAELVEESSRKAFKKLPQLDAAISCMTVLKGVGPATASGVLAAACPADVPFMADESMLSIPGLQPLAYTPSFYRKYSDAVNRLRKTLNKHDTVKDWTAHKVELTLWTHYLGERLSPGMFTQEEGQESPQSTNTASNNSDKTSEKLIASKRGVKRDLDSKPLEEKKVQKSRKRKRKP